MLFCFWLNVDNLLKNVIFCKITCPENIRFTETLNVISKKENAHSGLLSYYNTFSHLLFPNTLNQKRAIEMLVCIEIYGILSMLLSSFKRNGGSKIVLNGKCFISGCYSNIFEFICTFMWTWNIIYGLKEICISTAFFILS